ncbi:MAG TPA: hypothetical protein PK668_21725 [Myxococcota bacterium]|nr:hypothetical protein [Myxococcota bacterium]HRY96098.1 hypothetical protein [Myxococcota bacterium]
MHIRIAILGILLAGLVAGCDSKSEPEPCVPDCTGMQCGWDPVCDQICGTCPSDETCEVETGRCLCVPDCADRFCGPDHCGGSCGTCPATMTCNPWMHCQGEAGLGQACGLGVDRGAVVSCTAGLTCVDFMFEPDTRPCEGDGWCTSYFPDGWNPKCIDGGCRASLCAATCSPANGPDWCPAGFDPLSWKDTCVCVPTSSSPSIPAGGDCTLGPIHYIGHSCEEGDWCLGLLRPDGPACDDYRDCADTLVPGPGHDCVGGHCMFARCVEPCGPDCPASWRLYQLPNYPCICMRPYPYTRGQGEPCTANEVNAEAGNCHQELGCIARPPDPVGAPCPQGDGDCRAYFPASFNPDCVDGGCGTSVCAYPCAVLPCDCPDFLPVDMNGECYCLPNPAGVPAAAGEPCTFGEINDPGCPLECAEGLFCFGFTPETVNEPCATDVDCLASVSPNWNPDCVEGGCGVSFCIAPCVDHVCDEGFTPLDEDFGCWCYPSQ